MLLSCLNQSRIGIGFVSILASIVCHHQGWRTLKLLLHLVTVSHGSSAVKVKAFPAQSHHAMVNDFESRHQAKAHTKAQKSARIGDKSDYRNLLVAFDSGHNRVLKIERINSTLLFGPILDKKRRKTAFSISSQYIYPINDILYLVQIQTRLSSLRLQTEMTSWLLVFLQEWDLMS